MSHGGSSSVADWYSMNHCVYMAQVDFSDALVSKNGMICTARDLHAKF